MAEKADPSLDEILKAIEKLDKADLEKLFPAVMDAGRKKGCIFARRSAITAGHSRR